MKKQKTGFDMPFSWIFAIIAGSIILFLAIFATTQFIEVSKYREYTETAAQIRNYLNPIVPGLASAFNPAPIRFNQETRTIFDCYETSRKSPLFGRQTISFSEKSNIGNKWSDPGGNISIYNKYLFANKLEQGKTLYFGSVPFYLGFKVDDIIFISSRQYCFVTPPSRIEDQVEGIFLNINISNSVQNCNSRDVKVCFGFDDSLCNMTVYGNCYDVGCENQYETGQVIKKLNTMNYAGNLLYGAIFADPRIYECNIKRLGQKTAELSFIYKEKAELVQQRGCSSVIKEDLNSLALSSSTIQSSLDIDNLYFAAKQMDIKNKEAECRIYPGESY